MIHTTFQPFEFQHNSRYRDAKEEGEIAVSSFRRLSAFETAETDDRESESAGWPQRRDDPKSQLRLDV